MGVVPMWEADVQHSGDPAGAVAGDRGERRIAVPPWCKLVVNEKTVGADYPVRAVDQPGGVQQRNGAGDVAIIEAVGVEPGELHSPSKPRSIPRVRLDCRSRASAVKSRC